MKEVKDLRTANALLIVRQGRSSHPQVEISLPEGPMKSFSGLSSDVSSDGVKKKWRREQFRPFVIVSLSQKRGSSEGVKVDKMVFEKMDAFVGLKIVVASNWEEMKIAYPVVDSKVREERERDEGTP